MKDDKKDWARELFPHLDDSELPVDISDFPSFKREEIYWKGWLTGFFIGLIAALTIAEVFIWLS